MLTQAQIDAETLDPLTDGQLQALSLLVKRWPVYRSSSSLWSGFYTRLLAEQSVPTIKTKALKAVLILHANLPSIVVESSGTADSRSHFSTELNWDTLSRTILDVLFDVPLYTGRTAIAVVQRTIPDATLREEFIVTEEQTGVRL